MSKVKVKLMPPVLLGRYFQALSLYLVDLDIIEYGPDYIIVDVHELEDAINELAQMAAEHLEFVKVQPPIYGTDKNFLKKVLGDKLYKEIDSKEERLKRKKGKEAHEERVEVWKEKWKNVILKLLHFEVKGKPPSRIQILKASIHEYAKLFTKPEKDDELVKVVEPKGEALAIAGAILATIGRVGDTIVMLLPPLPESLRENSEFLNSLRARYDAIKFISLNYPFDKIPCSSEIILQFIFAEAFREKIGEKIRCPSITDNLFFASVASGGNRPMVNSITPLMASEILCKLGKDTEVISTILNQAKAEPNVAGACINDLFHYVISNNNPEFLYRCARRYLDTVTSTDEKKKASAKKALIEIKKVINNELSERRT